MNYWLTTALLAPVLLAQGLHARRNALLLPEPPGARKGTSGAGPRLRLLITGDSAASGVGAASQDEALLGRLVSLLENEFEVSWQLVAKTGQTTRSVRQHLAIRDPESIDVVVTSLGVNDVTSGATQAQWLEEQSALLDLLRQRFKISLCILTGLPPVHLFPALPQPLRWHLGRRARQFDKALRQHSSGQSDCRFVSLDLPPDPSLMAADGFHPGPAIYARWAELVHAEIVAAFG